MYQIAWQMHDGDIIRLPMDRYNTKAEAEEKMAKMIKGKIPHWIEEVV